jgi:5-methylthioadenosine/S-adenosylhomocysteine deaminase
MKNQPAPAPETYDLILRDCRLLTPEFDVNDSVDICIRGNRIAALVSPSASETHGSQVIDAQGKLAMPGLIDGHTHAAQQLLRGSVMDEMPMIWARILVPFESNLTEDEAHAGGMLFCLENLKAGITTFADAGGPHMEAIAEAVIKTGMRACIARSTMDAGPFVPDGMKHTTAEAVRKTETLYRNYHGKGNDRVHIWFSIRQAMTSTPELLEAVSTCAREYDTGIHIHLAEHLDEVGHCLRNYGVRPAEWFDSYGILGPHVICGHSVRLSDKEVLLMAERGANAVHCPRANLGNHGFSKTPLLMALGVNIALGTDGAAGTRLDLFEQMRLLKSAVQARYGNEINDPLSLPAVETLRMVTRGGARAVMQADDLGSLEVGKKADVILLDVNQPHFLPTTHLVKTLTMAAQPADVTDVIVDGQVLVRNRQFTRFDEVEIMRKAGEAMQAVSQRANIPLPVPLLN